MSINAGLTVMSLVGMLLKKTKVHQLAASNNGTICPHSDGHFNRMSERCDVPGRHATEKD
ncbi:hypothetical protein DPMN_057167 [Dreissena polymorpha]|uniref:Uncharacterized protein n=1 Tax=Dreissena polymorpha TaxID=45954 RepID=A0A9D4CUL9_DREPO|nr:hypothetical protein DPMN_057167 [Dreissena polymorpha]